MQGVVTAEWMSPRFKEPKVPCVVLRTEAGMVQAVFEMTPSTMLKLSADCFAVSLDGMTDDSLQHLPASTNGRLSAV